MFETMRGMRTVVMQMTAENAGQLALLARLTRRMLAQGEWSLDGEAVSMETGV